MRSFANKIKNKKKAIMPQFLNKTSTVAIMLLIIAVVAAVIYFKSKKSVTNTSTEDTTVGN